MSFHVIYDSPHDEQVRKRQSLWSAVFFLVAVLCAYATALVMSISDASFGSETLKLGYKLAAVFGAVTMVLRGIAGKASIQSLIWCIFLFGLFWPLGAFIALGNIWANHRFFR